VQSGNYANDESTVTNERGEFTTFVVPGERAVIQVIDLSKTPDVTYPTPHSHTFKIPLDADSFRLPEIEVPPAKTWTGRLVNQAGEPVSGKYVAAYEAEQLLHKGRTAKNGEFQLTLPDNKTPIQWKALVEWQKEEKTLPVEIVTETPLVLRVQLP
jgi:hypothetical protein